MAPVLKIGKTIYSGVGLVEVPEMPGPVLGNSRWHPARRPETDDEKYDLSAQSRALAANSATDTPRPAAICTTVITPGFCIPLSMLLM